MDSSNRLFRSTPASCVSNIDKWRLISGVVVNVLIPDLPKGAI